MATFGTFTAQKGGSGHHGGGHKRPENAEECLEEALVCLSRGQAKAAVSHAVDAVNRIAKEHGVHGYASC